MPDYLLRAYYSMPGFRQEDRALSHGKSYLGDLVGPGKDSTAWHILGKKGKSFGETEQVVMKG
jgi:hypothetical protein